MAICFSTCLCFSLLTLFLLLIIFTVHDHIFTGFTYPYYYYACSPAHSGAAAGHSNGIEGGPGLCFVLFRFVAQKGETERQSIFLCVCVTLTHLVSITHPKAVNNTVFVLFCFARIGEISALICLKLVFCILHTNLFLLLPTSLLPFAFVFLSRSHMQCPVPAAYSPRTAT